jgi:hypothetical protein
VVAGSRRIFGATAAHGLFLLGLLLGAILRGSGTSAAPLAASADRLGVNFVSAPGQTFANQAQRYGWAANAGAGWNRWAIYWSSVEAGCNGSFDWSGVDPVVAADTQQGLSDDAVLLGSPSCYATNGTVQGIPPPGVRTPGIRVLSDHTNAPPSGLDNPTFADGTDAWALGKAINPANPWARFVSAAVTRYHAQVHAWEIWNEPDDSAFWSGTQGDYARLLKVGWLAAHAADPSAQILIGGMMYWQWANNDAIDQAWLKQFLPLLLSDPTAAANDDYFEVLPYHFYSRSLDAYTKIQSAASTLQSFGLSKEIWLNETNAPACDDQSSAGPYVNCSDFGPGTDGGATGYASDNEQAAFILQATAFAFAAGAKRVFEFQLQDDGNGQALGMYRNDGSMRPIYPAEQIAAQYLAGFAVARRTATNGAEAITFGVPGPNPHRATVLFDDLGSPVTGTLAAAGAPPTSVVLIQQNGEQQSLAPAPSYQVALPAATDHRNYDVPWSPNDYLIGGQTVLLVENLPPDDTPPVSAVTSATVVGSPLGVNLAWSGNDPNGWGVADYTIQYRDLSAGGPWTAWLTDTSATSGTFTPIAGHQYQFRSLARDWAGNAEAKCATTADINVAALSPAMVRSVIAPMPYRVYFPFMAQVRALC